MLHPAHKRIGYIILDLSEQDLGNIFGENQQSTFFVFTNTVYV